MTIVNVDVTDVAGKFGPNDKIIFYSPVYREGASGEIISTAQSVFSLAEGPSTVDLAPGPVRIKFKVQGIADIRDKEGVVPATGPVDLADIIEGSFSYTPPVVNDAQAARDRAIQAASDAEGYATTASSQADVATDKAREANASANTAGDHADAADTARQGAFTARDQAVQSATDIESALDARIPAGLSLRVDTTVGTRVFAGDTMIYGDTGWRAITTWSKDGSLVGELPSGLIAQEGVDGGVYYRRVNGLVTLRILGARAESSNLQIRIPSGFDPGGVPWPVVTLTLASLSNSAYIRVGSAYGYVGISASASNPVNIPSSGPSYSSEATWGTKRAWPTSLPGLPA